MTIGKFLSFAFLLFLLWALYDLSKLFGGPGSFNLIFIVLGVGTAVLAVVWVPVALLQFLVRLVKSAAGEK